MSVINSQPLIGASGQAGYNLTKSLRFRSSASAYLNRTLGSTGSLRAWTWSAWVKRGTLGVQQDLFGWVELSGGNFQQVIGFNADNTLEFQMYNSIVGNYVNRKNTTQVFRDPSAWYHIVVTWDSNNATADDRARIYINGTRVTAWAANTNPALNQDSYINNVSYPLGIARCMPSSSNYFDGYLTEQNFIDGQALTPSSFGETSTTTGVWIPKKYTGTYGTNGFYLPFTDTTSTSTLGTDFSGNSNTWTVNNISLTAGTTYDSMTDVPTLTSATTANYCVLNPLVYRNSVGQNGYSNGNLTLSGLGSPVTYFNMATMGVNASSGKFYWECQIGAASSGIFIGVTQDSNFQSGDWDAWYDSAGGALYKVATNVASVATSTTNDVIGVAYDSTANTCAFYKNNTLLGTVTGLTSATMFPLQCSRASAVLNLNFGQRPFSYTPPTGFVALNTFNLPTPTIGATASSQANKYMDATLYTGAGNVSTSITNAGGFQPDLVWMKARSIAYDNVLYDSVRGTGTGASLVSNSTSAEGANSVNANMSAFTSNGFTIGSTSSTNILNASGQTFVGWQWRASNATAVTNTAGSITSSVSANTTAGFSVVTYTGTGSAGTVGHGLGVAPAMFITKQRSAVGDFFTYHKSVGATAGLFLNLTTAATTNTYFNNTAPTSSVFSIGTASGLNANGVTAVTYCFAEVAGYSAFGSYTGNGSTDGTFVFTGFRPRFVLIKRTNAAEGWEMFDSSRDTYNPEINLLEANVSSAEISSSTAAIDFLSNGFKQRNTRSATNGTSDTYIYACFAENPFKYSNAR